MISGLPPSFTMGVTADLLKRVVSPKPKPFQSEGETFASILEAGLGRTICRDFYFPYARKLWGLGPTELSAAQAQRRVSTASLTSMVRKWRRCWNGVARRAA